MDEERKVGGNSFHTRGSETKLRDPYDIVMQQDFPLNRRLGLYSALLVFQFSHNIMTSFKIHDDTV